MALIQSRRGFLSGIANAGAASLIRAPRAQAAEEVLETATVRFQKPGLCVSSLYIAEELLRAEGFTDIRYVDARLTRTSEPVGKQVMRLQLTEDPRPLPRPIAQ